ncbi:MAG: response regulator [Deltaproteobacteria bacterium]|nr:response regulator [Nannocystaceae bacterium]
MDGHPTSRLLAFARELQCADGFCELMMITLAGLPTSLGFHHAWLFAVENDDGVMRLLDAAGTSRRRLRELAPGLTIAGDAFLEELTGSRVPVVVDDAQSDPRTSKALAERLDLRTIVGIPLRLLDDTVAVFGTGTFGEEGCRPPAPAQLEYLVAMGEQIRIAADRIRLHEERKRSALALARLEGHLRQSQKMEAVGRLASGIAHDFNNLLSVILSFTELAIADLGPTSPSRADLDEVVKASHSAAALTRKLLSFSHNRTIDSRSCDLSEVVIGMDAMIRRLIGADIVFETVPQKGLAKVRADPGLIEQVLMNLVVNARDAMPTGGKLLVETCDVVLDEAYAREHVGVSPGPHVMLAVSDTGCGMDEATQERMFEPFFTTKEEGKGTGIGLSTVYGLITQTGGTVCVYSELGQGTTVRAYLPAAQAEGCPRFVPPAAVVRVWGAETILLVEDDEPLRRVAQKILDRHGYVVLEARDAKHALEIGEHHVGTIDLVLTDVVMPFMSGVEIGARLGVLRPNAAMLYMSGYTATSMAHHRGLEPGFALLTKPITPETLLIKVREVLDAARRPDQMLDSAS